MLRIAHSTRGRLVAGAVISALAALFMLVVNPFPADVLGQTTPTQETCPVAPGATVPCGGITVTSGSDQPCTATVAGTQATIACPAGFTVTVQGTQCTAVGGQTNVAVCTVASNARVSFTTTGGVARSVPAAPQTPAQLPRTGAGFAGDGRSAGLLPALALLALAVAFAGSALVVSTRRSR